MSLSLLFPPAPSWMWVAELSWHHQDLHPSPTFSCFLLPQIGDSLCLKLSDLLLSVKEQGQPHPNQVNISKNIRDTSPILHVFEPTFSSGGERERERKKRTMRLPVTSDDSCQAGAPKNLNQTANHLSATRTFLGLRSGAVIFWKIGGPLHSHVTENISSLP